MVLGGFLIVWGFLVAGMMLPYGFPDGLYGVIPGAVLILLGVLRLISKKKRNSAEVKETTTENKKESRDKTVPVLSAMEIEIKEWGEMFLSDSPDLNAMLEIARKRCNDKSPIGVAMMEEIQLAIVGGLNGKADKAWWEKFGFEPYALYRIGKSTSWGDEEQWRLPEEAGQIGTERDLIEYAVQKNCLFAVKDRINEFLGKKDPKLNLYLKRKNQIESEFADRLKDPVNVEKESKIRAEKICRVAKLFEAGKVSLLEGDYKNGSLQIQEAIKNGSEAAELWWIRYEAKNGDAKAYYQLAEAYKTGAYVLKADLKIASKLYKKSEEKGYGPAVLRYAQDMKEARYGNKRDFAAAAKAYRKLADQGDKAACAEYAWLARLPESLCSTRTARDYALRAIELCKEEDTFENRCIQRKAIASLISYDLAHIWSNLYPNKDIIEPKKPDSNTDSCYELALQFIKLESYDVLTGNLIYSKSKSGYNYIAINDWYKEHDMQKETVPFSEILKLAYAMNASTWSQYYHQKCEYGKKEVYHECGERFHFWDLVRGAILQKAVSEYWEAGEDRDVEACEKLCNLYCYYNWRDYRTEITDYWARKARNSGTPEGRQVYREWSKEFRAERMAANSSGSVSTNSSQKKTTSGESKDDSRGIFRLTVRDMPSVIHGSFGDRYVLVDRGMDYARYECMGDMATIYDDQVSAFHAHSSDGEYFWW